MNRFARHRRAGACRSRRQSQRSQRHTGESTLRFGTMPLMFTAHRAFKARSGCGALPTRSIRQSIRTPPW